MGLSNTSTVRLKTRLSAYRHTETVRLAKDMPRKDITVTQDETFTGGLCLVAMDPDSNFIILEQLAQARDQTTWNALMAPALAQLNCHVMQSTSDEAPGILAYVAHHLEAHHSPDLFHVQHELVKAVSAPLSMKERAAHKAATEAQKQLEQVPTPLQPAGDEPQKCGPGRPPKAPVSLEQAEQGLEAARREHERLAQQRLIHASLWRVEQDIHLRLETCVDILWGQKRFGGWQVVAQREAVPGVLGEAVVHRLKRSPSALTARSPLSPDPAPADR